MLRSIAIDYVYFRNGNWTFFRCWIGTCQRLPPLISWSWFSLALNLRQFSISKWSIFATPRRWPHSVTSVSSYLNYIFTVPIWQTNKGAVHKVRHAIFGQFWPPSLCHSLSHIPGPPQSTSHISDPRFIVGLLQKTGQKPSVQMLSQLLVRAFVQELLSESFVWKVLSEVVFVRTPFCQNTSVTTES